MARVRIQDVSPASGTTTYAYNLPTVAIGARGKLSSGTDADGVAMSYDYNLKGEQTTVTRIVPLPNNGAATMGTTTNKDVVNTVTLQGVALGICFHIGQSVASTGVNALTTSESYASTSGLQSGTISFGRQTLTTRIRPDANGVMTSTSIAADGTSSVTTITHGLTSSVLEQDSAAATIHSTTYGYDSLQHQLTITDSCTGLTIYGAVGANVANVSESGQPLSVTNNISATNPQGDTTSTGYDKLGRAVLTTLPDNTTTNTAYYPTGQVKVTWGSQTYPTWYVYDEAGRRTNLRTWKVDPGLDAANLPANPPANSQVTTWNYSAATGLLSQKLDAVSKGASYTYTAAGRMQTRTWARTFGAGKAALTTTYNYTNGFLTFTDYSASTSDVTTAYDALGRVASMTQAGQSKLEYGYNATNLTLTTETASYDLAATAGYELLGPSITTTIHCCAPCPWNCPTTPIRQGMAMKPRAG